MYRQKILLSILVLVCTASIFSCTTPTPTASLPTETQPTIIEPQTESDATVKPAEPADIIFHNGNIITIEKDQPLAEAVAIRGNLIQAVGSDAEILALTGSNTTLVDLKGKTMLPGIINNHTHYLRNGLEAGIPLDEMMANFLRFGYTSETEMVSIDEFINNMLEAEKKGDVPIRLNIYAEYNCGFLENGKSIECTSWYKDNPPILDPDRMVRIPGVKVFMDGDGSTKRGCQYQSFDFPKTVTDVWPDVYETCGTPHGDLYLTEEQLIPVLQDIQDRGYRAAFHAMGDGSIETILDAIQVVLAGEPNSTYRHEIVHCSLLSPTQAERIANMDVLAQFGGMFNVSEADWYKAAFGEDHYTWAANRWSLPTLGVHVSFGNDYNARGDIKNLNPFRGLYGYVTKKEILADGTVVEPPEWVAKHKISVERALELMTIEGAYALSMEEYTGSIRPGKYADLIIISDDPLTIDPEELINLTVWMTMVDGEVKYCAEGKDAFCPLAGQSPSATTSSTAVPTRVTPQPTAPAASQADPQTAQVKFNCNARSYSPPVFSDQTFLLTNINWAATTQEQMADFLDALQFEVFVNNQKIQSSMDHGDITKTSDGKLYSVLVYFDVGKLKPGEHEIRTVFSFKERIEDGFDEYGPGTKNPTYEGTCTVIIE